MQALTGSGWPAQLTVHSIKAPMPGDTLGPSTCALPKTSSRALHVSSVSSCADPPRPPRFDDTLGFPGEGPGPTLTLTSVNVTAWASFAAAFEHQNNFRDAKIIAVQEHKLLRDELNKARGFCHKFGLSSSLSPALSLAKGVRPRARAGSGPNTSPCGMQASSSGILGVTLLL
jgi:hypothetical protein